MVDRVGFGVSHQLYAVTRRFGGSANVNGFLEHQAVGTDEFLSHTRVAIMGTLCSRRRRRRRWCLIR